MDPDKSSFLPLTSTFSRKQHAQMCYRAISNRNDKQKRLLNDKEENFDAYKVKQRIPS